LKIKHGQVQPNRVTDESGTTYVWTDYLSKASAEWKSSVDAGMTVNWPVGIGVERSEGLVAAVSNTPAQLDT
jgi:phosphate transport system substrate-binding protein